MRDITNAPYEAYGGTRLSTSAQSGCASRRCSVVDRDPDQLASRSGVEFGRHQPRRAGLSCRDVELAGSVFLPLWSTMFGLEFDQAKYTVRLPANEVLQ